MNTNNDALWRECLRKASVDYRISIIDDVLDRDEYIQILANCDAVLSLHRAEGFGRLMAEAMALGIGGVLLVLYCAGLFFNLKTHRHLFTPVADSAEDPHDMTTSWSPLFTSVSASHASAIGSSSLAPE